MTCFQRASAKVIRRRTVCDYIGGRFDNLNESRYQVQAQPEILYNMAAN